VRVRDESYVSNTPNTHTRVATTRNDIHLSNMSESTRRCYCMCRKVMVRYQPSSLNNFPNGQLAVFWEESCLSAAHLMDADTVHYYKQDPSGVTSYNVFDIFILGDPILDCALFS